MKDQDTNARSFAEVAHNRHSCRAFLPEPLEPAQLRALFELAQRAPSDCNAQAWTVYLVEGAPLEALRARIYAHAATGGASSFDLPPIASYDGAFRDRRRACGWGLYEAVGIEKGDRDASRVQALKNFEFFGAKHLAIITVDAALAERGSVGAGIYLGYLLLAAEFLGIGALPQAAITHHAGILHEMLDIPAHHRVVNVVALGREDKAHPANGFRTSRVPFEEAVVLRNA